MKAGLPPLVSEGAVIVTEVMGTLDVNPANGSVL